MCRKRGLTFQSFGHAAVMRALNEADLGRKTDGETVRDEEQRSRRSERELPRGLGIRDRLQQTSDDRRTRPDEDETPASFSPPAQSPPLLASGVDEVMTLARTIVEAPGPSRRDVWKAACHVLARGRTQEMALQLADELDAAVRRLEGVPQTALERVRARMK